MFDYQRVIPNYGWKTHVNVPHYITIVIPYWLSNPLIPLIILIILQFSHRFHGFSARPGGAIAAGAWIHHSFEAPWERLHRGQAQPLRLLMAGFMGVFARSTRHTRISFLSPTRFTRCQGPNQRCCLQPGSLRQGRQVSMCRCKRGMVKSSIPSDRWMESQPSRGCAGFYATLHWSRQRASGKTCIYIYY